MIEIFLILFLFHQALNGKKVSFTSSPYLVSFFFNVQRLFFSPSWRPHDDCTQFSNNSFHSNLLYFLPLTSMNSNFLTIIVLKHSPNSQKSSNLNDISLLYGLDQKPLLNSFYQLKGTTSAKKRVHLPTQI